MKTNKFLVAGLLAAMILSGCSKNEDPVANGGVKEIGLKAGIGQATTTRAVIDADYNLDLPVAFARMNPTPATPNTWDETQLNATRIGGNGQTPIVFEVTQMYPAVQTESVTLIGYHPRVATAPTNAGNNVAVVSYTITGDEDIMATAELTGSTNVEFTGCTFSHLLAQLQFRYVGSDEAIAKWADISTEVSGVPTALELTLTKSNAGITGGASLAVAGGPANDDLPVHGAPTVLVDPADLNLVTGYCMIFPTADMGTDRAPIELNVNATYDGTPVNRTVQITNIAGGIKAGQSHIITLAFTETGEIVMTAEIAPWLPGSNGNVVINPTP